AAQRKDRLELAITPLLGRTAGGVAFDKIELAQRRIAFLAIGELAGKTHRVEHALAPREFAGLTRRLAGARGVDNLAANYFRVVRVFEHEIGELGAYDFLHHRHHLGGNKLVLRLRTELRLRHLDAQHAAEAFAHVVAGRL